MPPRQKTATEDTIVSGSTNPGFLHKGQLVHIVSSGRTLTYREVLDFDDYFLKFRSDVTVAPQTEVVLIPWAQIEAIGLTDER